MVLVILLAFQVVAGTSDYQRGVELFEKGQAASAVPFLLRATEQQPRDARAWKALGVAYAAQGRYDVAEPAFARACRLDAALLDACYYDARALYALDRFEESLKILQKTAGQNSWKVHLGIAQAQEALGQAAAAEKEYKIALSMSAGEDPKPGVAYGLFLIRQGRFEEAMAPLEQVLRRFPRAAEAHIYLGRALLEQGRTADAVPYLEQAVALAPASAQAHLLLGKAYARVGRSAEARPHFDAAARYEEGSRTVR